MGEGFPTRPTREAFGPDPRNRYPVRDPEQELAAEIGRLLFWQVSGMGLVVARAWAHVDLLNPTPTVLDWAAAWDPRREASPPTIGRVAQGDFRITFAAQYPDESGEQQAFDVGKVPYGFVDGATFHFIHCYREDATKVRVLVKDTALAAVDGQRALVFIR